MSKKLDGAVSDSLLGAKCVDAGEAENVAIALGTEYFSARSEGSSGRGSRWNNLRPGGLLSALLLEEDTEATQAAAPPAVTAADSGAHAPAKKAVDAADGTAASSQSQENSAATMSAKEYLSRFQAKCAEVAQASSSKAPSRKSFSREELPVAKGSRVKKEEEPGAGLELKAKGDARSSVLKGASSAGKEKESKPDPGSKSDAIPYSIDVKNLTPKTGREDNKWVENHRSEYNAMMSGGETVSPHQNLAKVKTATTKRKPDEEAKERKKLRREDDTNDTTFERRQALWSHGTTAAAALAPKQQVDSYGVEIKSEIKREKQDGAELPVAVSREAVSARLQDDVQVAEGLRCPRWLWEALYPYQHLCVQWLWGLHREKLGGILADEMGLGKTIQIIAYLAVLHHSGVLQGMRVQNTSLGTASAPSTGGVLIVCPATLISQWRNELHLWYPPLRVCVMHQVDIQDRKECIRVASTEQGVLITSYETMRIAHEELLEATWTIVILDEGQKIRNPNASVTMASKRFSTPHRIVLSGSPIQNNLQELWSIFDFICPGRLGTLPVFLEEFAQPIESGNLVGANQTRVAAAYQCALALRELTLPCILRRTKAEVIDVLRLPHKQEQVLFCHLTPEQYQVYVDFLQTEQVRKALASSHDRKVAGAAFFAIGVLRKLCNHPDLLLRGADAELQPPDMFNYERSGKMKVLSEIMKCWKSEGHRPLIFVQTIQMLEVIQQWLTAQGYTHLRIDGKTPVKRRLKMIEEFNGNESLFAMLLTTRVGGVGLNIVGADRVIIFDPDWNPMTDVQARERTWRIGQKRDVAVYRLVLTGTVEEKIYQRQVYKHFLAQKVLTDPRQRQFFKWNDLADLFDVPPVPPNFNPEEMAKLKEKYKNLFRKLDRERADDEDEYTVETTEVMKSISELPTTDPHQTTKDMAEEHNTILQTLYDTNGIKASFNHDKVEQPLLDRKIVRDGANMIAERALAALKKSARERASHHISEPTWTGSAGMAGAKVTAKRESRGVKREPSGGGDSGSLGGHRGAMSADILDGLRQLAAIRQAAKGGATQAEEATRMGLSRSTPSSGSSHSAGVKREEGHGEGTLAIPAVAIETDCAGLPIELHASDKMIAEAILLAFWDKKLAGSNHCLTTGQVLQHLAHGIADHHRDLFKAMLKQMCVLTKPSHPGQPGVWTLHKEFWPRSERGSAS